jgi:hypothetical protein
MADHTDFDALFEQIKERERRERRRRRPWRAWLAWLRHRQMVRRVLEEFSRAVYADPASSGEQGWVLMEGWPGLRRRSYFVARQKPPERLGESRVIGVLFGESGLRVGYVTGDKRREPAVSRATDLRSAVKDVLEGRVDRREILGQHFVAVEQCGFNAGQLRQTLENVWHRHPRESWM